MAVVDSGLRTTEASFFDRHNSIDSADSVNSNGEQTRQPNSAPVALSMFGRIRKLFSHRGLRMVFAAFLLKRVAFMSENFIDQYTSEKLHLKISQTGPVRSSNSGGSLLVTSTILPLLSYLWSVRGTFIPLKDLWLARLSVVVAIIGFISLWKAKNFYVICLGRPTRVLQRIMS